MFTATGNFTGTRCALLRAWLTRFILFNSAVLEVTRKTTAVPLGKTIELFGANNACVCTSATWAFH